jgi:hypothetical protein
MDFATNVTGLITPEEASEIGCVAYPSSSSSTPSSALSAISPTPLSLLIHHPSIPPPFREWHNLAVAFSVAGCSSDDESLTSSLLLSTIARPLHAYSFSTFTYGNAFASSSHLLKSFLSGNDLISLDPPKDSGSTTFSSSSFLPSFSPYILAFVRLFVPMAFMSVQSIFKYPTDSLWVSKQEELQFLWPSSSLQKLLVNFLQPFSSSLKHIKFDNIIDMSGKNEEFQDKNDDKDNTNDNVLPSEPSLE